MQQKTEKKNELKKRTENTFCDLELFIIDVVLFLFNNLSSFLSLFFSFLKRHHL